MKKILFALPVLFALACGDASQETANAKPENSKDAHAGHNHDGHDHGKEEKVISIKTHDPVCKMDRDEKWTFVSVYENDTVKFCNPVCKEKFDKDPASFVAQK